MANPQITLPTEITTSDKTPRTAIAFDRTSGVKQQSDTAREVLLIGQMMSTSTIAANTPTPLLRETDSEAFGVGSSIDLAAKACFKNNPNVKLTAVGIADAGVKATGTITVGNGNASATGEVDFFIAGKIVPLIVTSGDTPTVQASNLAAAINARTDLPATATAALGVVTVNAKEGGIKGNTIAMSYLVQPGYVPGSTYTLSGTTLASGTGTVTTTSATAAVGAHRYHVVVNLFDDTTTEQAIRDFVVSQGQAEIGYGQIVITAQVGALSAQTTQALAINGLRSVHLSINGTPTWYPEIAGGWAGVEAGNEIATMPRNGLTILGVVAPPVQSRWLRTEIRTLIDNGCTPLKVYPGELVGCVREVSTCITNTAGNKDYSVLDITKVLGFDDVRDNVKLMFDTNYQRSRWAPDDPNTGLPPADLPTDVATPSKVTGDLLAVLRQCESRGIVSNVEALASQIVVNKVGTQCQFSIPAQIVDGMHEKLGKVVYIYTPFGS